MRISYYLLGAEDVVTVGGCRQYENHNKEVDPNDAEGIWNRATSLMPNLKGAKKICDAVGLRPHRGVIRVERQNCVLEDGTELHVVHHYGHGGYGVMVSPGSAVTASRLVGEILRNC